MIPQPHEFFVEFQEAATGGELRILLINTKCSIEMNVILIGELLSLSSSSFFFLIRFISDQDKVMKEQDLDLHAGTHLY